MFRNNSAIEELKPIRTWRGGRLVTGYMTGRDRKKQRMAALKKSVVYVSKKTGVLLYKGGKGGLVLMGFVTVSLFMIVVSFVAAFIPTKTKKIPFDDWHKSDKIKDVSQGMTNIVNNSGVVNVTNHFNNKV